MSDMRAYLRCADKGTGKKQDIKITGASTLAGDEVDRMVKDAEKFADEDKKKREAVDVKNQVCFCCRSKEEI